MVCRRPWSIALGLTAQSADLEVPTPERESPRISASAVLGDGGGGDTLSVRDPEFLGLWKPSYCKPQL